jgi:hypothetical protein
MMRIRFNAAARLSANLAPDFRVLREPLRALRRMAPVAAVSVAGLTAATVYAAFAVARARRHAHEEHGHEQSGEVLERLTYLHDRGNLSDDEYTRQREKLLATAS